MTDLSATAAVVTVPSAKETWADILLTRGPVTVIALGGTGALFEGIFPLFDLQKAIFGSALLLVAAGFDLCVWMVRRADVKAQFKAIEAARIAAEARLVEIDRGSPSTQSPKAPVFPRSEETLPIVN